MASPWQPEFMHWAFNVPRGELGRYWNEIPTGLDLFWSLTGLLAAFWIKEFNPERADLPLGRMRNPLLAQIMWETRNCWSL